MPRKGREGVMKKLLFVLLACLLVMPAMAFYEEGYTATWPAVTDGQGHLYHDNIAVTCAAPQNTVQVCKSQDDSAYLVVAENDKLSIPEWESVNQNFNEMNLDDFVPHKKDGNAEEKKEEPKVHLSGTTICEFETSNREPVLLTKIEYFGQKARVEERMMKIIPGKGAMLMGRSYDSNPDHAKNVQEQMDIELANTQEGKETFLLIDPSLYADSDLHLLCSEPFPKE